MWSQFVTTSKLEDNKYRSKKYLPYVFTEQGIAMLSGLLKNEIAIQVSVNIMNAFIEMRKFIANNANIFNRLTTVEYNVLELNKKFDDVFNQMQNNKGNELKQKIFFEGQIYDAYSLIINIIKSAKTKVLIIDNYIDDTILEMLTKKNKDVKLKQSAIQKEMDAKQKILNNLVDKLAVADDLDDIIIQRIRSTKNEMQELQKQLDEISKEIEDSNYKRLDLDFIESLLEKCADIRELDSNEQRLLIGVLVDKILWDGNTQDVTVYFIGSGDVKKK